MVPELMASSKLQLSQAGIPEFITADVWSFGMLLQSLMNPGSEPFLVEATMKEFEMDLLSDPMIAMAKIYNENQRPVMLGKYNLKRSYLLGIFYVYPLQMYLIR